MAEYFDLYPLVFLTGKEQEFTLKPLGYRHQVLNPGDPVNIQIFELELAQENRFAGTGCTRDLSATVSEDGCVRFSAVFEREGNYLIHYNDIFDGRVYALDHDMAGRYPFRGDLHMHTNRSDGTEPPAVVASNYRGHGYDFTVISDHGRYYPSLEARKALGIGTDDESELTDLLVVTGEEIHLPHNDVHYVNFGGKFSVNALVTPWNAQEAGDSKEVRSLTGECPDVVGEEAYTKEIMERSKSVPLELESERVSFAAAQWIYEKVQQAGGLGIFPHPYWICGRSMQLSESYTRFFYENRPFDAFEVLGGENYYQHNGFQTAFYYEEKAKGISWPVVGSTDSHGSTKANRNSLICSTIVFAPENKTEALIDSIKNYYSVAVDTISTEYRLVGDFRWIKYGSFLMENWYPIHDRICAAEGTVLREYVLGDEGSAAVLKAMKGKVPSMMKKYFNI